jgi:hypothetical protein
MKVLALERKLYSARFYGCVSETFALSEHGLGKKLEAVVRKNHNGDWIYVEQEASTSSNY